MTRITKAAHSNISPLIAMEARGLLNGRTRSCVYPLRLPMRGSNGCEALDETMTF